MNKSLTLACLFFIPTVVADGFLFISNAGFIGSAEMHRLLSFSFAGAYFIGGTVLVVRFFRKSQIANGVTLTLGLVLGFVIYVFTFLWMAIQGGL